MTGLMAKDHGGTEDLLPAYDSVDSNLVHFALLLGTEYVSRPRDETTLKPRPVCFEYPIMLRLYNLRPKIERIIRCASHMFALERGGLMYNDLRVSKQ